MAERKKVQKINPRMKTKNSSKSKEENKKIKKSALKESKPKKSRASAVRYKPENERIVMKPAEEEKRPKLKEKPKAKKGNSPNPPAVKHPQPKKENKNFRVLNKNQKKNENTKADFKVLSGNKLKIRKRRMIFAIVSLVVVVSVIVFVATSPTGPVERITNAIALWGGGEYPASLSGTGVVSIKNDNEKTFALTNSHLSGFNTSGKRFIELQHNFSNPVLETSSQRVLIFNRESTGYMIANNSDMLFESNVSQAIYCADICNSGATVFATASPSYAAQISVYSKDMEQYFSWYLAEGLVTDVALSDDGELLAVATITANKEGRFVSKIYCFDTEADTATPIIEKTMSDEAVLQLENVSETCFLYRSNVKLSFIKWEDGVEISTDTELPEPAFYSSSDYGISVVYGETAHSKIISYDLEGNKLRQIEFNGLIDDLSVYGDTTYILSGNQINIYSASGTQVNNITLEQSPSFISATDGGVLAVNNLQIAFYEYTPTT